jgi:hypothetical protein
MEQDYFYDVKTFQALEAARVTKSLESKLHKGEGSLFGKVQLQGFRRRPFFNFPAKNRRLP